MTLVRKALIGTGVLLLAAVLAAYLLPRHVHVERSISIDAPRDAVFTIVNSFARFNEWSPWAALDPNATYSFEGPPSGVGAKLSWVGDPKAVGTGSLTITGSTPPEVVTLAIQFGPQSATGTLTLRPDGQRTRVTWSFETDLGSNPFNRYFGPMFDGMVGRDFERGLSSLKDLAERGSPPSGNQSRIDSPDVPPGIRKSIRD